MLILIAVIASRIGITLWVPAFMSRRGLFARLITHFAQIKNAISRLSTASQGVYRV